MSGGGGWTHHSDLTGERESAIGVTLPSGTYLFGGRDSESRHTTDFLPASTSTWQAGPVIPGKGSRQGCGVAVSDTEIVIIGDYRDDKRVIKYSSHNNQWTRMTDLQFGRYAHSCAVHNGKIIVAGGLDQGDDTVVTTEIIDLSNGTPRTGGNLKTPRYHHAIVTLGGLQPKVLAIGGDGDESGGGKYLASIEEWNEEEEKWEMSSMNLSTERREFGAIAISSALVCPK